MNWFTVLKWTDDATSEGKLMLTEIFNVPLEELRKLNIPIRLTQRLYHESNLEAIDEENFTLLMKLSEQGRYQELVDALYNILDRHVIHRRRNKWANMTDEELKERNRKIRERRANRSDEEKEEHRKKYREWQRERRAKMTDEEREERNRKHREYRKKKSEQQAKRKLMREEE